MVMQVDPRRNALAMTGATPHDEPRGDAAEGPSFDAVLRRETPPEAPKAPREGAKAPREPARAPREAAPRDPARAARKESGARAEAKETTRAADDDATAPALGREPVEAATETPPELTLDPRLAWMIQLPAQPQAPAPVALALELSRLAEDPAAMESIVPQEVVRGEGLAATPAGTLPEAAPTAPTTEAPRVRADEVTAAAPRPEAPRTEPAATPAVKTAPAAEDAPREDPRATVVAEAPKAVPTREVTTPAETTPAAPTPATAERAPGGDTQGDARREGDTPRERADAPVETAPVVGAESVTRPTVASAVTASRDAAVTEAGGTSALRERLARAVESSANRVGNEVQARGEVNDAALGRVVVTATQRAGAVDLQVHADRDDTLQALKGQREGIVAEVQTADVKVGALRFDGGGTDVGLGDGSPRHGAGDARDARSDAQGDGGGAAQERSRGAQRLVEAASPPRSARVRAVL
jgi:ribonuclease E